MMLKLGKNEEGHYLSVPFSLVIDLMMIVLRVLKTIPEKRRGNA